MSKFLNLFVTDITFTFSVLAFLFLFLFLFLFFIFYFIQYIYISFNLKKICKIVFDDERHFRLPLEPFNCFFISVLPIVFWRETLNIKYGMSFKKLYGKEFYYPIDQTQLKLLLKEFSAFFYIQYVIYWSVLISGLLMLVAVIFIKNF